MLAINEGRPIAEIGLNDDFVGIIDGVEDTGNIINTQGIAQLHPLPDLENRFVEYIAGPSGSGKSTVASELANVFYEEYPKIPIFIFSRTDPTNDPAFEEILDAVTYIPLNENLVQQPLDITTNPFLKQGCLMIFDDVTTVHNDLVKREIEKLLADAMEVGRKLNCNMIITNHLVVPNEKKLARTILNELNMLTVFPRSGSTQQIRYALKTYFGLNNNQIEEILGLKSRWIRISKSYPMYVLYEYGAYIL